MAALLIAHNASPARAAGGGGGSNLLPIGGTACVPSATSGPSVTISYTVPVPTTKDECKKGGWRNFGYLDQGTCVSDVNLRNR